MKYISGYFIGILILISVFSILLVYFDVNVGNVIAMGTALFSVAFSLYAYYESNKKLIFELNYQDMKKSTLSFKYHLQKIIDEL